MPYDTVAIDFDGVIAHYHGWRGVGEFGKPIEGVAWALTKIREAGKKVVIHTTRGEKDLIVEYLTKHRIPYDYINHNPQNEENMNPGKPIADVYVDDRAVCFKGRWDEETLNKILGHKSWHVYHKSSVPDRMKRAIETYEARNLVYGDNYKTHGRVMEALFPDGITLKTAHDFNRFGILNMIIAKLGRYCYSFNEGGHPDSTHDMGVYSFMLEELDGEGYMR